MTPNGETKLQITEQFAGYTLENQKILHLFF